ncbi:WbqC family protein [Rhodoblastus sp.]|uniref:WbqC family protein n=1 Tax=Rhodoblastus sp. TaxID=1962975 RepID=UPI002617D6D7|nr:WbqC family protein [Rhodoblastus sp.]
MSLLKRVAASRYVNPIGGAELYGAGAFERHGLELGFLETSIEPRPGEYPYLSIVHTMMTESETSIGQWLSRHGVRPG